MDQLELLKKDWKRQESSLPKLSKEALSKLIHKKSSSIVKWIFIISLLEFVVPHIIFLFIDSDKIAAANESINMANFTLYFSIFTYGVALFFIYQFYRNYKSISANSNPKILMQNIIKTRKTVKYYIWFSLSMIPIVAGVTFYKTYNSSQFLEQLPAGTSMTTIWLISILLIVVVVVLFWLFYRLIYGILLNKLKVNYKELIGNEMSEL